MAAFNQRDCIAGNLVADAWVHSNVIFGTDIKWARAAIALVNGGSIRAPIEKGWYVFYCACKLHGVIQGA